MQWVAQKYEQSTVDLTAATDKTSQQRIKISLDGAQQKPKRKNSFVSFIESVRFLLKSKMSSRVTISAGGGDSAGGGGGRSSQSTSQRRQRSRWVTNEHVPQLHFFVSMCVLRPAGIYSSIFVICCRCGDLWKNVGDASGLSASPSMTEMLLIDRNIIKFYLVEEISNTNRKFDVVLLANNEAFCSLRTLWN